MSWQKCPVCNGTGNNYGGLQWSASCPNCKGHGIISEISGLPPAYEIRRGLASTGTNHCIRYIPSDDSIESCKMCGRGKWLHPTYVSSPNSSSTVTSIDKCVMCGENTIYLSNTPISVRMEYVEGAGQLCQSCYAKS